MADLERARRFLSQIVEAGDEAEIVGLEEATSVFELIGNQKVIDRLSEKLMLPGQSVLYVKLFERRDAARCVGEMIFLTAALRKRTDYVDSTVSEYKLDKVTSLVWEVELVHEIEVGKIGSHTTPWSKIGKDIADWAKVVFRNRDYKIVDEEGRKKVKVRVVIENPEELANIVDTNLVLSKLLDEIGVDEE